MESANYGTNNTPLHHLHNEMQKLIQHVHKQGLARINRHTNINEERPSNKSIVNLAQYLALREIDLRPLQEELAEAGLSSLGRAEPHVYANLENIMNMLCQVLQSSVNIKTDFCYPKFKEGFDILDKNANKVLGNYQHKRFARIMVTLPAEAATNYKLVYGLIKEGMDIARINCAHDDISNWQKMIENIRKATAELKSTCRILMDLAGHKIRTGPIMNGPQLPIIKINKDFSKDNSNAIKFKIIPDKLSDGVYADTSNNEFLLPVPKAVYTNLADSDRFSLLDARKKQRYIKISISPTSCHVTGLCNKSIHLATGTKITWQRYLNSVYQDLHTFSFVNLNPISDKIHLHIGDDLFLHKFQTTDFAEKYPDSDKLPTSVHISCTVPEVIDKLELGAPVWIDDGKIYTYVSKKTDDFVVLRISKTGPKGAKITSDKGLNLPGTTLNLPALTKKDKEDLSFICKNADMVGFSFVETADDMRELIAELTLRNASKIPIIAKIETARAVKNLPDILFASMPNHPLGVMIARGDLAVELGSVRMAEIQEEILWLCEAAHVPVVWATQVLESIAKYGARSRPEFTDAAMSVRAECVMLNKGPYILDALRSLNAILKRMQDHQHKKISRLRALHW